MRTCARIGLAGGLLVALVTATADPMRPLPGGAAATEAHAGGDAMNPALATAPAPATGLLGTRRDSSGRWEALVGERWIGAGERLGDARVREVAADRIVLLRGSALESVYLIPPLTPQASAPTHKNRRPVAAP